MLRLCVTLASHKFGFVGPKAGNTCVRPPLQEKRRNTMATNRTDLDTDVASRRAGTSRRADSYGQRRTFTESKAGFKTTEFMLTLAAIAAILIAVYVGDADLDAADGWRYASWVAAAYIVSRGLAKLGTREPYAERFDGD
jgi:hypothetical protein